MSSKCCEFVDSRLRRSPPDRASAVPYGQAGENAMRFPHLAHRSAAAHKLHSTPQQDRMNLISGKGETSSRLPAFSLFFPEAVQTTGTVVYGKREAELQLKAGTDLQASAERLGRQIGDAKLKVTANSDGLVTLTSDTVVP